jgi:DNA-binding protein H-NS
MATLTALNKKIAALEAQAERIAKAELGKAIAQIRKIMADSGVTIEHLKEGAKSVQPAVSGKSGSAKAVKAPKGKKPPKYKDPKSGATWSGLGRIPAWIANAKSRDAFLIEAASASAPAPEPEPAMADPVSKAPAKRAASKTVAKATRAGKASATKAVAKKAAPQKQAESKKKASAPVQSKSEPTPPAKAATKTRRKTAASKKKAPDQAQVSASDSGATAG